MSRLYQGPSAVTPSRKGPSTRRGPFPLNDPRPFPCAWEKWRRQGRDGWAPFTRWNQRAGRVKPVTPAQKSPGQAVKKAPPVNRSEQFSLDGLELGTGDPAWLPSLPCGPAPPPNRNPRSRGQAEEVEEGRRPRRAAGKDSISLTPPSDIGPPPLGLPFAARGGEQSGEGNDLCCDKHPFFNWCW